jgi:2-polyprenyl-3-methyl-5-hydroxy-6-metoxy-1,4-benzoquinol methylase
MVFLNPALKDNFLEEYYRINHEEQSEIVELDTDFYRTLYTMGLDMIAKSTHVGNLLDVGCSSGSFLDLARQYGWKTHGLELNQKEAARCRAKGHNVVEQLISSAEFGDSFQAITLWDVFEHIKDGVEFLKTARKRLNNRGVVFLQSPTVDSLAAKILQEKCNMFDGLEHVNLYSNKTLHIVARNAGFRVVSYQTVISEIGVINNYLNYEDPYLGRSNNKDHLFRGAITQSWLLENNLGYKYQACLLPC